MRAEPLVLLLCLTLATACSTTEPYRAGFWPGVAAGESQRLTQSLEVSSSEAKAKLIGVVELRPDQTALAVLNAQGLVLLSVRETPTGNEVDRHPDVPAFVDAGAIMNDVRLVNWPSALLRNALTKHADLHEDTHQRSLSVRSKKIATAYYEPDRENWQRAHLINHQRGYEIRVELI